MNDQERGCDDDEQPKPPAFRERLHCSYPIGGTRAVASPTKGADSAAPSIKRTRFARAADVFTCPGSGSRSEMRTSQQVKQPENQKAKPKLSMLAMAKPLESATALVLAVVE